MVLVVKLNRSTCALKDEIVEELHFYVQASSPRFHCEASDEHAESLGEAVEYSFPLLTEKMFMAWKGHRIPLCYKYDLSVIVEDLLELLVELQRPSGEQETFWGSDTFCGRWFLKWGDGRLEVQADWRDVGAGLEKLLASEISIPVAHFLAEWKRPLGILCDALQNSGYTVENLPAMQLLKDVHESLTQEGILYRNYHFV